MYSSEFINDRIDYLNQYLKDTLSSKSYSFNQAKELGEPGIYIVWEQDKVLYVGKTTRKGKTRLGELASDYRSHTMNNKLLKQLLIEVGIEIKSLTIKSKATLIESNLLSLEDFVKHQASVNEKVKNNFSFQFCPYDKTGIAALEHYFIAILAPPYND